MKKQVGYGSNFAFIHRRFSWNEGSKQRDREEQKIMRIFLISHRFPPWNTFHPYYHTRNFFQIYVPSENAFSRRMKISKVGRREIVVIKNFSSVVNSKQLTFNIFHTKVPWRKPWISFFNANCVRAFDTWRRWRWLKYNGGTFYAQKKKRINYKRDTKTKEEKSKRVALLIIFPARVRDINPRCL